MALLLDGGEPFRPGVALALVAAYAAASRVQFAIGFGYTAPTQLVFVPMLFLLPPGVVPLAVVAGVPSATCPTTSAAARIPTTCSWCSGTRGTPSARRWCSPPPAPATPGWGDWPIYVAALAAQFALDGAASTLREWLALGISPRAQPRLLAWVFFVDLLLTPIGLLAAFAAEERPALGARRTAAGGADGGVRQGAPAADRQRARAEPRLPRHHAPAR